MNLFVCQMSLVQYHNPSRMIVTDKWIIHWKLFSTCRDARAGYRRNFPYFRNSFGLVQLLAPTFEIVLTCFNFKSWSAWSKHRFALIQIYTALQGVQYFHCALEHLILFIHCIAYLPSICKEHGDGGGDDGDDVVDRYGDADDREEGGLLKSWRILWIEWREWRGCTLGIGGLWCWW